MTVQQNEYVATLPMLLTELEVVRAERVTPSFVRIELGGDALAEFGTPGPVLDQRIKIIFPNAAGNLPSFADADESWWTTWMEIPEHERGSMRTYTVRDVVGEGTDTRLVVDIVVHEADHGGGHEDGGHPLDGAGNRWALQARAGAVPPWVLTRWMWVTRAKRPSLPTERADSSSQGIAPACGASARACTAPTTRLPSLACQ